MSFTIDGIDYDKVAHCAFFTPMGYHALNEDEIDWGARILWIGKPGSSKTSLVRRLARRCRARYYCFRHGARGEAGTGVVPVPDMTNEMLRFFPPDWACQWGNEIGLLNLDEINAGVSRMQQAPLLGMLQDKEIGSTFFPPQVRMMATCNDVEDTVGADEFGAAVANRICHVRMPDPTVDLHNAYLLRGGMFQKMSEEEKIDPVKEQKRVMDRWNAEWAHATALATQFARKRPELHRQQPAADTPEASGPWVSPRTKDYAVVMLASSRIHGLNLAEADLLIAGYVGEGWVREFREWERAQDIPDFDAILEEKAEWKHSPSRLDRTAAVLAGCAARLVSGKVPKTDKKVEVFWKKVMEPAAIDVADVVKMLCETVLMPAPEKITGCVAAAETLKLINPIAVTMNPHRKVA